MSSPYSPQHWCSPTSAQAYNDPISRGLAEFLNIFSVQAVPRQVVAWRKAHAPGTVVVSTQ